MLKLHPALVVLDQKIRDAVGKPVMVASGYRTPERNRQVGGVPNSQHLLGRASDLVATNGVTTRELCRIAASFDPPGLGGYDTFVHVDVRTGRKARWGKVW
ncbi:MAG: YcbK family protein [Armatimonadota bacterium]